MNDEILVTDASPLITLASAGALDLLLLGGTLFIPDAVFAEAANDRYADGRAFRAWAAEHVQHLRVPTTAAGTRREVLLAEGRSARNLVENAAIEFALKYISNTREEGVILLYEDRDMPKIAARLSEPRLSPIPLADYLGQIERAGLIPSARAILLQAQAAGRNVDAELRLLQGSQSES